MSAIRPTGILFAVVLAATSLACPTRPGPGDDAGTGGASGGSGESGGAGGADQAGGSTGGAAGAAGSTGGYGTGGSTSTGGTSGISGSGGMPSGSGGSPSCPVGQTNCGGTCTDLTSDDMHCGACSGVNTDCTHTGTTVEHCRASVCRLEDGSSCTSDADCLSGECKQFYADSDNDGYPDRYNTARFCAFPATGYIPSRADVKWDCCDFLPGVHPGATQFVAWNASSTADPECMAAAGDTNCDGTVEVDPTAQITTACCDQVTRTPTAADCGVALCGCGGPGPNLMCELYCPPLGAAVGCR
jgi:hypothetical protein